MTHSNSLYHHGIKGMKWGVRRYQKKDGSLTAAGKKRYSDGDQNEARRETGKKIAKGLATGAAVGLAAYAMYNPKSRQVILDMAGKTMSQVKATTAAAAPVVKAHLKKAGTKTLKTLGESTEKVGKAMSDAALASMGTIAISKLTDKLATTDADSEAVRNKNKVILDTAKAGIEAATKANGCGNKNNNSGNNKGGNVGSEITNAIGAPSKKPIDKQTSSWQELFKDSNGNQRDSDTRATIKSMASAGYDIDQISEYLRQVDNGTIKHSYDDVKDELYYYCGANFMAMLG
jgi:hypothetical protein